jgi:rhodanese-related sulfurtransferase
MLQSLFGFKQPGFAQRSRVQAITPQELDQRLKTREPLLMVDVRSPEEYEQDGHIAGSRLLPLPMLARRLNELPTDRPIILVCRSGNRSEVACEQLMSQGFSDVINLTGGMIAWRRAGLPYE